MFTFTILFIYEHNFRVKIKKKMANTIRFIQLHLFKTLLFIKCIVLKII